MSKADLDLAQKILLDHSNANEFDELEVLEWTTDEVVTILSKVINRVNDSDTGISTLHKQSVKARYFRVTFTAKHPKGTANGAVMYVTNGTYLGGAETIADIEKTNGVTNVAILSITELNESDYNYYMNH